MMRQPVARTLVAANSSITSSARAKSRSGTFRPSTVVVARGNACARAREFRESAQLMEQLDYSPARQFVRPPAAVYFCSADRSPNVSASARATLTAQVSTMSR